MYNFSDLVQVLGMSCMKYQSNLHLLFGFLMLVNIITGIAKGGFPCVIAHQV